jgi:hypothetical protein
MLISRLAYSVTLKIRRYVPPKCLLHFNCLHVFYILEDRHLQTFFFLRLWIISVAFVGNLVLFYVTVFPYILTFYKDVFAVLILWFVLLSENDATKYGPT